MNNKRAFAVVRAIWMVIFGVTMLLTASYLILLELPASSVSYAQNVRVSVFMVWAVYSMYLLLPIHLAATVGLTLLGRAQGFRGFKFLWYWIVVVAEIAFLGGFAVFFTFAFRPG